MVIKPKLVQDTRNFIVESLEKKNYLSVGVAQLRISVSVAAEDQYMKSKVERKQKHVIPCVKV